MATIDQIKQAYQGYTGWNDPNAIIADYNATGGAGKGANAYSLGKSLPLQPATTTPAPAPVKGQSPAPAQTSIPPLDAISGVGGTPQAPINPQSAQDLVNMGYNGYQGWDDAGAMADFKATKGQGKGSLIDQTVNGSINNGKLNLVNLYDSLFKNSGIPDIEKDLSTKAQQLADTKAQINDNPFLSEATRVGRVAKLEQLYNETVGNIQKDLATKKADIETRINLETKQFDINSQTAKDSLSYVNTLLTSGALNNASPQDIAAITRSTGIPSSMIQSAISSSKSKSIPTQVITATDDKGNVTAALINTQTGQIINKTSIGTVGKSDGSTDIKKTFLSEAGTLQGQSINGTWVGQFPILVKKYASSMSLQDIYSLYMQSSLGQINGQPTEDPNRIQQLYNMSRTGNAQGIAA